MILLHFNRQQNTISPISVLNIGQIKATSIMKWLLNIELSDCYNIEDMRGKLLNYVQHGLCFNVKHNN